MVNDRSHRANIVGNEVSDVVVSGDSEEVLVQDRLTYRMRMRGEALPEVALPPSRQLEGKPDFSGDRSWPGIGVDVEGGEALMLLPVEQRYGAYTD